MRLVTHEKFDSAETSIQKETDIVSDTLIVENFMYRKNVGDTDIGNELRENIQELEELLQAYRDGDIISLM